MNIYILGIAVMLFIFMLLGMVAGKLVRNTNDYYVAGRKAPVTLIVGSLIASFLSTGVFMGDAGEVYNGFFMGIVIVGVLQALGYVYGAGFFGKYIRRIKVNTVPEYFGWRFQSKRLRKLASLTMIVAVIAYLLSVMQGVATIMSVITGWEYKLCTVIAWLSFTLFTVWSGAMGVLITDTIMFLIFFVAALMVMPYIVRSAGGWDIAIAELARSTKKPGIIAWTNNLEYLYNSGIKNLAWAIVYGIVWAIVVMVSPWQTSRYLMAKDEHTVMRSSVFASMGTASITTILYFIAAFIYKINPNIEDSSTVVVWAVMNCVPAFIGMVMLTGILAAGISSASTFLSLIGFSLTADIFEQIKVGDEKHNLGISRVCMTIVSVMVLIIAYFNPPQIFWIMYFGGTVIASSWGILAISSVWNRNISEFGAFLGMLMGFIGCVVSKIYVAIKGSTFPIYFDPFFIGIIMSIAGILVGSYLRKPGQESMILFDFMHITPKEELDAKEIQKTNRLTWIYIIFAILFGMFFVFKYAIPYLRAVN